jgi:hypothetical protein
MMRFNVGHQHPVPRLKPSPVEVPVYTREAFRAILARQPEWKVRAALEDGNIPSSNIEHALEWLEEQASQHRGYWS